MRLMIAMAMLLLGTSLICWAQPEDFIRELPSGAEVWHQEEHKEERKQIEKRFRNIENELNRLKKMRRYKVIVKENGVLREKIEKLEEEVNALKNDMKLMSGLENNFEIRMKNVEGKSKNIENDVKRLDKQQKILQDNQENIEQNILIILLLILTLSLIILLLVI